jgi:hypothetical protein
MHPLKKVPKKALKKALKKGLTLETLGIDTHSDKKYCSLWCLTDVNRGRVDFPLVIVCTDQNSCLTEPETAHFTIE